MLSNRIKENIRKILARRLSEKQRTVLLNSFSEGKTVNELAEIFDCTKLKIESF